MVMILVKSRGFWYISHMPKKCPFNAHSDVSSRTGGLNGSLSLNIRPNVVYACSEGYGEHIIARRFDTYIYSWLDPINSTYDS